MKPLRTKCETGIWVERKFHWKRDWVDDIFTWPRHYYQLIMPAEGALCAAQISSRKHKDRHKDGRMRMEGSWDNRTSSRLRNLTFNGTRSYRRKCAEMWFMICKWSSWNVDDFMFWTIQFWEYLPQISVLESHKSHLQHAASDSGRAESAGYWFMNSGWILSQWMTKNDHKFIEPFEILRWHSSGK